MLKKIAFISFFFFSFFSVETILCKTKIKNYSCTNRSRNLQIKDQNGKIVGYLLGSLHSSLTEEEINKYGKTVEPLLKEVKTVHFECIPNHWTKMGIGIERKMLQILDEYENIKVFELESLESQIALTGSIFLIGKKQCHVPYGNLFMSCPTFAQIVNGFNLLIWSVPNLIYRTFINPNFITEYTKEQRDRLSELRKHFLNGKTGTLTKQEVKQFRIIERDKKMYAKLQKNIGTFNSDNKFLLIIGMGHVSTNNGIISHFEKNGYKVESL
jgi:uncharacterized protein YbaP (TraB family)